MGRRGASQAVVRRPAQKACRRTSLANAATCAPSIITSKHAGIILRYAKPRSETSGWVSGSSMTRACLPSVLCSTRRCGRPDQTRCSDVRKCIARVVYASVRCSKRSPGQYVERERVGDGTARCSRALDKERIKVQREESIERRASARMRASVACARMLHAVNEWRWAADAELCQAAPTEARPRDGLWHQSLAADMSPCRRPI